MAKWLADDAVWCELVFARDSRKTGKIQGNSANFRHRRAVLTPFSWDKTVPYTANSLLHRTGNHFCRSGNDCNPAGKRSVTSAYHLRATKPFRLNGGQNGVRRARGSRAGLFVEVEHRIYGGAFPAHRIRGELRALAATIGEPLPRSPAPTRRAQRHQRRRAWRHRREPDDRPANSDRRVSLGARRQQQCRAERENDSDEGCNQGPYGHPVQKRAGRAERRVWTGLRVIAP
jgi:hypothetical protein